MADCERCGARAGMGKTLCKECTSIVSAEKERERRKKEQRDREFRELREREKADNRRRLATEKQARLELEEKERRERFQKYIDDRFARLQSLIDAGITPYLYDELTVDSQSFFGDQAKVGFWDPKIQHNTNVVGQTTNLEELQRRGVEGWEVVASIPVTYGAVLTNYVGNNLAYAGGYGGMTVGARLILRLPVTAGTLEASRGTIGEIFRRDYRG